MNVWSNRSKGHMKQLHPLLQLILNRALPICDIALISSLRGFREQEQLVASGASRVNWPNSKHNRTLDPTLEKIEMELSDAVDIVPHPSGYRDVQQMIYLVGILKGIAASMGIPIRCGLDWNGDGNINNKKGDLFDVAHIELVWGE